MTVARYWYCCARLNRADKGYFAHQLDGFDRLDPLVVTWEDGRPAAERGDAVVLAHPWNRSPRFRGGHRIGRAMLRLRALAGGNPFAARGAELRALMGLAQRHPPKLLYCHTGFVALRLMPVAEALDVPLVVHFHGLDINIRDPLHQAAMRRYLPRIDRALVVASWMIPWFAANGYDRDRIGIVPMGVPLAQEAADTVPPATPPRFVSVGRFVAYKGIDRSIAAFAQLRETHPDARLMIVGDGPERDNLKRLVGRLDLEQAVDFTGPLPARDTMREIAAATALLHHALDEPEGPEAFGVVITEAMALGRPVIGTRCGGIPDQVVDGETGFLIEQDDVAGMAAAMRRLLEDPALADRMGAAGRARAAAHFDAHALAREIEGLLTGLA